MEELWKIGIDNKDIKIMSEINNELFDLSDEEIKIKIDILKKLKCSDKVIRNIIISNPEYLSKFNDDIINLINKLYSLGLTNLDITFDSNPWLLNYEVFEIEDFIKEKQENGLSNDEIIDLIDQGNLD